MGSSSFLLILAFFLPVAALLFAGLASIFSPRSRPVNPAARPIRLIIQLVAGVLLLGWSLFSLPGDLRDVTTYNTDPTCQASTFDTTFAANGACRIEAGSIASAYINYGKHHRSQYRMHLATWSGAQYNVQVSYSTSSYAVWKAAQAEPGEPARFQIFKGRVTRIGTAAGVARTLDTPQDRFEGTQLLGAVGAGILTALALEVLFALALAGPLVSLQR